MDTKSYILIVALILFIATYFIYKVKVIKSSWNEIKGIEIKLMSDPSNEDVVRLLPVIERFLHHYPSKEMALDTFRDINIIIQNATTIDMEFKSKYCKLMLQIWADKI